MMHALMETLPYWELLSYMITALGLPVALFIFIFEQRKERENEEEEIYQMLSDAYVDFLKLVLANPDLKLHSNAATPNLDEEQQERMLAIFELLVSLLERVYMFAYEENMSGKKLRRWHSWEDYMQEWCRREDFRALLPNLLHGEDPEFAAYLRQLARKQGYYIPPSRPQA